MRSRSSRTLRSSLAVRVVRIACALGFASVVPALVVACKQPPAAVAFDAGPPPAPTPTAPAQLVPMDEDAGSVPDANPPPMHHPSGPALTTNQARAKQCCAALKASAKTDPMLAAVAAQCETVAMQMGPTKGGAAPELAFLKTLPKLPALCQGL
jgi:hypothetical protein